MRKLQEIVSALAMKGISSLFPHTEPAMQEQDLISHARKGDVPACCCCQFYGPDLVMLLSDSGNCSSLPPVGQIPALKELYVEGMKVVKSVGVELYGGNQPFQCLEKLKFREMPEWEEWQPSPSGCESPDFPHLKELGLYECPKLRGNLPTHLPSLKTLYVNKCEVLHKNRASNTLNVESLRGSLEKLTINGCPGLSLLLESTETLPSLQQLDIDSVGGKELLAQMVHNSNRLQSLTLYKCSSPLSFPTNGLPTTLMSLSITDCKKLEFLSREMMAKLTSLQSLRLSNSCERKGLSICSLVFFFFILEIFLLFGFWVLSNFCGLLYRLFSLEASFQP